MTMTVRATYEGGVLRPAQPLELAEGDSVDVTIVPAPAAPPMSEDELLEKINACQSYDEWMELMDKVPLDDGGYDIVKGTR